MRSGVFERAVIFAPRRRDEAIATAMLAEAGIAGEACPSLAALVADLRGGAGLALVTKEALHTADPRPLAKFLGDQAEWSDFPWRLLTGRGGGQERNPAADRDLDVLGNNTFLELPFHPTTLVSLARAALRAPRRQYNARSRLRELHERERRMQLALDAGRLGKWTIFYEADGPRMASCGCTPWPLCRMARSRTFPPTRASSGYLRWTGTRAWTKPHYAAR